jgi:hypothetical protein
MRFISGRENCHIRGLNSYVIRDRVSDTEGMIRVFHCTGDCLPALSVNGEFCLAAHNHRQDITLSLLQGSSYNVDFEWDSRAPEKKFYEWRFYSQIVDGNIEAHYSNTGDLRIRQITPIPPRFYHGLFLRSTQIHTVVATVGSAWLIREGSLAPPEQKSLCYTMGGDFKLSSEGLYRDLSIEELRAAWEELGYMAEMAAGGAE